MTRRLLLSLLIILAPALAEAETCTVSSAYTWTAATQDVSGSCTEDASDRFVIASGGALTIPAGTTIAVAEVDTDAGGAITINGTLNLTDCNDATSRTFNNAECGGNGTWNIQGSLLHDSRVSGAVMTQITRYTTDGRHMRLNFNATPSGGNFAAGDVLVWESGPARTHQYAISAVNTAGCASATEATCYIDIEIYRTGTLWGTASFPDSTNKKRDVAYPDATGTPTAPVFNDARIASPRSANYDTSGLDRKVVLCSNGSGTCIGSAAIAGAGAYAGWYITFSETAAGSWTTAQMGRRYLILDSENDIATPIATDTGTVDVLTLAEPIEGVDRTSAGVFTSSSVAPNSMIWPGFYPSDDWVIYRPATLANTGAEKDSSLGFYGDTMCLDADYAKFVDWTDVPVFGGVTLASTSTCTSPMRYVIAYDAGGGTIGSLTETSTATGCNAHTFRFERFQSLALDHLAVVDSTMPADTSTTCCAPLAGSGGACSGGFLVDSQPTSGTHGFEIADIPSVTITDYYARMMGDDAAVFASYSSTNMIVNVDNITCWMGGQGESSGCMDVWSATGTIAISVKDAVSLNWSGLSKTGCAQGTFANGGQANASIAVDRAVLVDIQSGDHAIFNQSATLGENTKLSNALVYARDYDGGANPRRCAIAHTTNLEHVWVDGFAGVNEFGDYQYVKGTYWKGYTNPTTTANPLLYSPGETARTIKNNIWVDIANPVALMTASTGVSAPLTFDGNLIRYVTYFSNAMGTYADTARPFASFSNNVFENAGMLNCSGTTWGATNGAAIGVNIAYSNAGDATSPIENLNRCTGADVPLVLNSPSYVSGWLPVRFDSSQMGPQGVVGVADHSLLDELEIESPYSVRGGGGAGGFVPRAF